MPLDPSIALGVRPIELPNQLAQYGQLAAIQNAQNQNALAQYQLSSAQRADEQQNNLYAAAKRPDFKLDLQTAIQYGPSGIAAFKVQNEAAKAAQDLTKTKGEITAQDLKAASDRNGAFASALAPFVNDIQNKKPILYGDVVAQANRLVAQGLMRKEDLGTIPTNEAELPQFIMNMAASTESSRKALELYLTKAHVAGGNVINVNPLAPGGIGKVLAPVSMTEFETARVPILQQTANAASSNAKTAADRLKQEGQGVTYVPNNTGGLTAFPTKLKPGDIPRGSIAVAPGPGMLPFEAKDASKTAVSEQQASYNIGRVLNAAKEIKGIVTKDPSSVQPGGAEAFASSISMPGTANAARSANRQIVYGAQRDALDALLYLATGAAYNKEQLEGQMAAYIPQFTDEPEAVAAKQTRMSNLIQSAKARAGKAWTPDMESAMKSLVNPATAASASNVVVTPDGQSHTFPTPAAAAQFKTRAGIQ